MIKINGYEANDSLEAVSFLEIRDVEQQGAIDGLYGLSPTMKDIYTKSVEKIKNNEAFADLQFKFFERTLEAQQEQLNYNKEFNKHLAFSRDATKGLLLVLERIANSLNNIENALISENEKQ